SEDEFRAKIADKVPEQFRENFLRKRPIELRPVDRPDIFAPKKMAPHQAVWVRATASLPPQIALQQCVLAYASDMTLLDTSLIPHGIGWVDPQMQIGAIDYALLLYTPFRSR